MIRGQNLKGQRVWGKDSFMMPEAKPARWKVERSRGASFSNFKIISETGT